MNSWLIRISFSCIFAALGCSSGIPTALPSSSISVPVTSSWKAAAPAPPAPSTPLLAVDPAQLHQAASAFDFTDSVGLNTHFSYTDTAYYLKTPAVISAIQKLQVRHIRDGLSYSWVAPNLYAIHGLLEAAGIRADLVVPNPANAGPLVQQMKPLLLHYPDAENIEAPNEYDQARNANWAADLRAYLPTVFSLGHNSGMPVFGPSLTQPASYTSLGNVASTMDFNNYHAYWGGRNPETWGWGGPNSFNHYYGSLAYDLDELQIDGPNVPVVITETGYVVQNTVAKPNLIPESVEAIYEPRLLLHLWNSGVKRTYIYELLDEPSSTTGFGLLHSDLTPRPAYTAIVNLMGLLADTSAITPAQLGYTLSGSTIGVESTLLQKSDGTFWLALWLKGPIYDVNALKPISVPLQVVNLAVLGAFKIDSARTFDEKGEVSSMPVNAATTSLTVGSGVTLVNIKF